MQERYTNSLETKTGENIWSEKLISHNVLCSTRTVITVAVLQYHFQENKEPEKKHLTGHSQPQISSFFTGFGPNINLMFVLYDLINQCVLCGIVWVLTTLKEENKNVKLYRSSCVYQIIVSGLVCHGLGSINRAKKFLYFFLHNQKVLNKYVHWTFP